MVVDRVFTEEDFDRLGEACEWGDYPGTPGEWMARPQGRPKLAEEELATIAFKAPHSQHDAIDCKAESRNVSHSELLCVAFRKGLASA